MHRTNDSNNRKQEHYVSLTPYNNTRNPWFGELWSAKFGCRLKLPSGKTICAADDPDECERTCAEDLTLRGHTDDFDTKLSQVSMRC